MCEITDEMMSEMALPGFRTFCAYQRYFINDVLLSAWSHPCRVPILFHKVKNSLRNMTEIVLCEQNFFDPSETLRDILT